MINIPNAKESPRIVNGVLRWYCGDTFDLQLTLDLEDQDREPVVIQPTDKVEVVFLDRSLNEVKTFTFTEVEGNTVVMTFDEDVTALFDIGDYTYDVYYTGEERVTLAEDNKVVVE